MRWLWAGCCEGRRDGLGIVVLPIVVLPAKSRFLTAEAVRNDVGDAHPFFVLPLTTEACRLRLHSKINRTMLFRTASAGEEPAFRSRPPFPLHRSRDFLRGPF